ncbi:tetratricopeptide repeat protein [Candidatus Laterigemmans baculatus]|uniref:tetratricopeptide repeat protein n=1 Tax=Candidatus Laterigemmans baculatus TaxID=2770505 RepID=UPI00193F4D02|nr:tetratricopeptide repeat protein [Candidatus Laterigemmans baculatus]
MSLSTGFYLLEARETGLRTLLLNKQLGDAVERDDWKTARVVLHRQLRMAPDNRQAQFELARALYATGEQDQAVQLMRQLVYSEEPSPTENPTQDLTRFYGADPQAAEWLVENLYLPNPWEELSDQEKQELLGLLAWLNHLMPEQVSVKQSYAEHLLKAERYAEALPVLVELMPESPGIGLRAAIIARALGDADQAKRYAQHSLEKFATLVSQRPSDASLALALTRCQIFLERYPDAVQTLRDAMDRCPQERSLLEHALAKAYVTWAATLRGKPDPTVQDQLQILAHLQHALEYAPNNQHVIQMVADEVLAAAESDDEQVASLRESLLRGTSPGISHFIRGTAAVLAGDDAKGAFHLELAAKSLPDSHVILNNLAFVMSRQENSDLEQALRVAETAIAQAMPPTPYHYETRGQILCQLGRYVDAVPDLEAGLAVPALAAAAHRSLAICYEQLGEEELSAQHHDEAEKLAAP